MRPAFGSSSSRLLQGSALLLGVVAMSWAVAARAAVYESPVYVDDDDDIVAMQDRGEISDETADTLRELLQDGIDLNLASRDELYELPSLTYPDCDAIIEYRKTKGQIDDPAELVAAGALTADQLSQIAPFVLVSGANEQFPIGGKYSLWGMYTATDKLAPPMRLRAQVRGPVGLSGAIGLVGTRRELSQPFYDPIAGSLEVTDSSYQVFMPKFWARWRSGKFEVVAGTFRLGFGQRLTLDNTLRQTPEGIYPDNNFYWNRYLVSGCTRSGVSVSSPCLDSEVDSYVTDDFIWRDSFRGVAASAKDLEIGDQARASLYAFASYQTRSVYQYDLYDKDTCLDPRNDGDPQCSAPQVLVRETGSLVPSARLAYSTLRFVWDELAVGARARIEPARWLSLGVTGYFGMPIWRVAGVDLDFQENARYPFGGRYGAVGVDGRLTVNDWNLFLEVTRSFDQRVGGTGGGFGVLQRSVWGANGRELELSARYYDFNFVNPYARGISSPDRVGGQRARNELGGRIKYTDRTSVPDMTLRAWVDFWVLPHDNQENGVSIGNGAGNAAGTANLWALLRADFRGWRFFQPSLWLDYRNKDLRRSGVGDCYDEAPPLVAGEPLLCTGELYRATARVHIAPWADKLSFTLQYQQYLMSSVFYDDRLMPGSRATVTVQSRPHERVLIRLRSRMYLQDQLTPTHDERSVWSYGEVTFFALRALQITARYDNYLWFDQRASTARRYPNPEHRFRLELEGRF